MMSSLCDILNSRQPYTTYNGTIVFGNSGKMSTMRRQKTYLQASMTANTLTNRMFAAIHKERLDAVNTETIAREFYGVEVQYD